VQESNKQSRRQQLLSTEKQYAFCIISHATSFGLLGAVGLEQFHTGNNEGAVVTWVAAFLFWLSALSYAKATGNPIKELPNGIDDLP
jgi:hypothetical protein